MPWSTPALVALLVACGSGPVPEAGEETPPLEPEVVEGHPVAAADLLSATRAWRTEPGPLTHRAVLQAAERGLAVQDPSPDLDVALGDALANVLLRPDLGLPRLERQKAHLDGDGVDAWLDALTRTGDLPRLAREVEAVTGEPLDPEHPTARVLAHQAAADPFTGWEALRDAVRAAQLTEVLERGTRLPVDRPVPSAGAAMEVLALLLPGWDLEGVTARSALPSDPDPLLTPGTIPAAGGRKWVLGYARTPADLRPPGVSLDLARPAQGAVLAARARLEGGRPLVIAGEGTYRDGVLWLFAATDPERMVLWMDATEAFLDGRKTTSDEDLAPVLRDRFRDRLLSGT